MTPRDRFLETMRAGHSDRAPLWDEGVQEETVAAWREQGMPPGTTPAELFVSDRREILEVNLGPLPYLAPPPTAAAAASRSAGPAPRRAAGGSATFLTRLRSCYRPDLRLRFPANWELRAEAWQRRDYPLGMVVSRGLFRSLGIEDWPTMTRVLYALCDEPAAVEATMEAVTELSLWALEQVLSALTPDFAVFNEPIASFHAPVVSPAHYRRFALPHVRRVAERLRAAGVPAIILQSYGQVEALVPLWLEAGINTAWCFHAGPSGIDYMGLRRRYGRGLRLIGGIPATALREGRPAIDAALATTVAPLLEEGGYLPLADDRVRREVPFESYRYYRAQLERLATGRRAGREAGESNGTRRHPGRGAGAAPSILGDGGRR